MIVYLARPITGLSYDAIMASLEFVESVLHAAGYQTLCPLRGKTYLRSEREFRASDYRHPVSTNHAIVERDSWMVARADIVFMDLSDARAISIGCMMELAWGHWLRKHTIVVLPPGNVHRHAFVLEAADVVFATQAEALHYLCELAANGSA